MIDNGKLVYFICTVIATGSVYLPFFRSSHKWRPRDIFYSGHVFILSLALFAIYSVSFFVITFRPVERKYQRDSWRKNIESRIEMTDDLERSNLLDSKSVDDVIYLLGGPARKYKDAAGNITFAYYVGYKRKAFSIDPFFLMIEFRDSVVRRQYLREGVPYSNNAGDSLFGSRVYFN